MLEFDSFFEVTKKCLKSIGIEFYPKPAITKREKLNEKLREFRLALGVCMMIICFFQIIMFLRQNIGDLEKAGATWSLLFLFLINLPKTLHLIINRRRIEKLMDRMRSVYDTVPGYFNDRYEWNFKINKIIQVAYIAAICGADFLFCMMPIVQNIVAIANGADHWERRFNHNVYFPFDTEPSYAYVLAYIWIQIAAPHCDMYMTSNENFFDTLLVMISMEFDNLADEFERFNYRFDDEEKFKKLIDRHNELLEISDEMKSIYRVPIMNTIIGSSLIICFSLLQFFTFGEKIMTPTIANITNLVKFAAYLNGALLQIFLLSYFCEKLRTSSENVAMKVTLSNWYEGDNVTMKKNLLIVLAKAQKPVELDAMGFFGINLETFTNTVSSAWSYFSFLKSLR